MPGRINAYLERTGQEAIADKGQLIRVVLESLAMIYRVGMEKLEQVTGDRIDTLHIVGGGIQNELLCQFGANALGRKVITGPVEATAARGHSRPQPPSHKRHHFRSWVTTR